jgi:hypothetical protein
VFGSVKSKDGHVFPGEVHSYANTLILGHGAVLMAVKRRDVAASKPEMSNISNKYGPF